MAEYSSDEIIDSLAKKLYHYRLATNFCDQHQPDGGAVSVCQKCALIVAEYLLPGVTDTHPTGLPNTSNHVSHGHQVGTWSTQHSHNGGEKPHGHSEEEWYG